MVTELDFQRAVNDPGYRPRFLREIDLEDAAKYIGKVGYKDSVKVRGNRTILMRINPSLMMRLNMKKLKSEVEVYPQAFSIPHTSLNDFLCSLIDHEGYHAREYYENPRDIIPSINELMDAANEYDPEIDVKIRINKAMTRIAAATEYRAYEHEIKRSKKRGVSEVFSCFLDLKLKDNEIILLSRK